MRKSSFLCYLFAALTLLAGTAGAQQSAVEGSFARNLTVSGPVDLEVMSGSGDIQVRTGNATEVRVSGRIRARRDREADAQEIVRQLEADPPIQQNGNEIIIGRADDGERLRNVSISYEVVVPAQTEVEARSGSGDVTIEGVQRPVVARAGSGDVTVSATGSDVDAQAGSGDVSLRSVQGTARAQAGSGNIEATDIAGPFTGSSGSGDIEVRQTASGDVSVQTGSGDIGVRGVQGALRANTGSGTIVAEGGPAAPWDVRAASGDIRLRLPSDAAFDLEARTASGDVSTDHPMTVQGSLNRGHLQGRVRGGGPTVSVRTASGDIRVE